MNQRRGHREFRKYLKTNENKNRVYQNLQDAAEIVGRGKFIAVNAYVKKELKSTT